MERRLLQIVIGLVACVPILAGGAGVLVGPALNGVAGASPTAHSHFSYLSGLLLGIGLCYWSCLPAIERKGERLGLLTLIVFIGGLGRLFSLFVAGAPSIWHQGALAIELCVAPAVWLWHRRLAGETEPLIVSLHFGEARKSEA
ncbi:MAG: DUF4345 domain-containing protein [Alphaproteobacteria bacterium]